MKYKKKFLYLQNKVIETRKNEKNRKQKRKTKNKKKERGKNKRRKRWNVTGSRWVVVWLQQPALMRELVGLIHGDRVRLSHLVWIFHTPM